MKKTALYLSICSLGAMGTIFASLGAAAQEWPIERQNSHRTARVSGQGEIAQPEVRARVYLGGSLDTDEIWVGVPNADGEAEIAMIVGGKVILKDSRDRVVWDTYSLQASHIFGLFDFDGDASYEYLILGSDGLHLLRGREVKTSGT